MSCLLLERLFVDYGTEQSFGVNMKSNRCLRSDRRIATVGPPSWTGAGMAEVALTERQRRILAYIKESVETRGYPPSVREIGEAVGLRSPSSVHSQLSALHRGGFLRRDPSRPRALDVRMPAHDAEVADEIVAVAAVTSQEAPTARSAAVPLLGEIAAGAPITADEQVAEVYALPRDLVGEGTLFMLKVRGESMLQAGVFPGDLVVIRQQPVVEQGEMCAAMIDGEATVKFFRRTKAGEVFLDPANDGYEPIPVPRDAQGAILGKVVAVLRSL
jgi:repressor LexA